MDILIHSDGHTAELYHHGILGQKWGIRRYQNKDGSLTAAGQKHRTLRENMHDRKVAKKRKQSLEKARATKARKKEAEINKQREQENREWLLSKGLIPVKQMSNDELKRSQDRVSAEKTFKETRRANSTIRRVGYKLVNETIVPAVTEAGKDVAKKYVTKKLTDLAGLGDKPKQETEYDKELKRLKKLNALQDEKRNYAKSKKEEFQYQRDYTEAKKKYDEYLKKEKEQEKE